MTSRPSPIPGPGPASKPSSGIRRCPICGKPAEGADRPFCSARCADVDLNRWLGGVYAIPVADDDIDDEPSDDPDAPPR